MSDFSLIKSIINHPTPEVVIVEAPTPAVPATTRVELGDIDIIGRPEMVHRDEGESEYALLCDIGIAVFHPAFDPDDGLQFSVHASLHFLDGTEDNSFGYSYGSENGTAGDVDEYTTDFKWVDVKPVPDKHNIDLYRLPEAQFAAVMKMVTDYLTSLSHDEIEKTVKVEQVKRLMPRN